jgi:hypothetical protein
MATSDPPVQPPATSGAATNGAASSPARVTAATASYVTRPTGPTLFLRTFIPWQLWRFARINLKMLRIIRHSRR